MMFNVASVMASLVTAMHDANPMNNKTANGELSEFTNAMQTNADFVINIQARVVLEGKSSNDA